MGLCSCMYVLLCSPELLVKKICLALHGACRRLAYQGVVLAGLLLSQGKFIGSRFCMYFQGAALSWLAGTASV